MSLRNLLSDLLGRLTEVDGSTLLIGFDETRSWPESVLDVLVQSGLVAPASPAKSLVCGGCEEDCVMPVQTLPGIRPRALIVCDKREDIGRIPVALERLQQWQLSEAAVVRVLLDAIDGHPVTEQQVRNQLAALPLPKLLSFKLGRLQVDTDRLLRQLLPQSDTPQPNRFALTGDHWTITYEGQTRTVNNSKGIRYIAYLLQNQGQEIHVPNLYYAINPPDVEDIDETHSRMTVEQLGEEGLSIADLADAEYTQSRESYQAQKQRLEYLADQIEEAIELGEEDRQIEHESEQERILQNMKATTGLGRGLRKAPNTLERIRTSVAKRINSDIKNKISPILPQLGHHLKINLRTGTQCQYSPDPQIKWKFDTS